MDDFQNLVETETERVLKDNRELSDEMREILEETTGFKAPPDKLFLTLLAIRKIAVQLKSNDAVKYLNFAFFKKRNKEINEKWIKNRRRLLEVKIQRFEEKLAKRLKYMKYRLNSDLNILHSKRNEQLNSLNTKYMKCKNLISEINSKEQYQLKKLKKIFLISNEVPEISSEELNNPETYTYNPNDYSDFTEGVMAKDKILIQDEIDNISQKTIEKSYRSH